MGPLRPWTQGRITYRPRPKKGLFIIKEHRDEQDASFGGRVDAFISLSYPDECMLLTGQAIELGINFKVFVLSVGPGFTSHRNAFGARTVEGIIGGGAWNAKSSPGAKKIAEHFKEVTGEEMGNYWVSSISAPPCSILTRLGKRQEPWTRRKSAL